MHFRIYVDSNPRNLITGWSSHSVGNLRGLIPKSSHCHVLPTYAHMQTGSPHQPLCTHTNMAPTHSLVRIWQLWRALLTTDHSQNAKTAAQGEVTQARIPNILKQKHLILLSLVSLHPFPYSCIHPTIPRSFSPTLSKMCTYPLRFPTFSVSFLWANSPGWRGANSPVIQPAHPLLLSWVSPFKMAASISRSLISQAASSGLERLSHLHHRESSIPRTTRGKYQLQYLYIYHS